MLQEFISYLEEQLRNCSIYVWGAQGQNHKVISENWIRRMETSAGNAERAIRYWKAQVAKGKGDVLRAFDCSGLIMYYFQNLKGILHSDINAHGLKGMSSKLTQAQLRPGDFVFRLYTSGSEKGRAYHVGVVVDEAKNVIECKGRDDGVVKRPLNAVKGYWNYYGRPSFLKAEIEGDAPTPAPAGWGLSRLLKRTSPTMKGEDVRTAQSALIASGYSCGRSGADGLFGGDTEKAVCSFQRVRGLAADGIVGKDTCAALGGVWKGSAPAQTWTLSRLLKKASPLMKGEDVKRVQEALIKKGYSCGGSGTDGQYGNNTAAAVKRFQGSRGLAVDGVVGEKTCAALGGVWKK